MKRDEIENIIYEARCGKITDDAAADAILASLTPEAQGLADPVADVPTGYVMVPKSALDWLNGEGPDPDGKWFGDCADAERTAHGRFSRRYWWRSKFLKLLAAAPPPPATDARADALEEAAKVADNIANTLGSYVDTQTPEAEAALMLKVEKLAGKLGDDIRALANRQTGEAK